MKSFMYQLDKKDTINILKHIKDKLFINSLQMHNLSKLDYTDKNIFKFNVIFNKENNNVLSKEIWYKNHNGYICIDTNIIIIESENENANNVSLIIKELENYFDISVHLISINAKLLKKIKKDKELISIQSKHGDKLVNKNIDEELQDDEGLFSCSYYDNESRIYLNKEGLVEYQNFDKMMNNLKFLQTC